MLRKKSVAKHKKDLQKKSQRFTKFPSRGAKPQLRTIKGRKNLQRSRYKNFYKSTRTVRRPIHIRRQTRSRRCRRTHALLYRQTLISTLPMLSRIPSFVGTYHRPRFARSTLFARANVQKFNYIVARDLQPMSLRAQVFNTTAQTLTDVVRADAPLLAPSTRGYSSYYRTPHTDAVRFHNHRITHLLKHRRARYFGRRVRKMYIDLRRKRLTRKTRLPRKRGVRRPTFLIVRKANRGRYAGAFGKRRRHIERRERTQIKRALYVSRRKLQLASRVVRSPMSSEPARLTRAAAQKAYKMSPSPLSRSTAVALVRPYHFAVAAGATARYTLNSYAHRAGRAPASAVVQKQILNLRQSARGHKLDLSYRARVKIRLPNTYVSRARRRKSGRGLLISANAPKTLASSAALRRTLLAPKEVLSFVQHSLPEMRPVQCLLAGKRLANAQPRFWLRPPRRSQRKALY